MRPDHAIPSLLPGCQDPLVVVGRLKGRQERCGKKVFVFIGRTGVGNITTLSGTWKVDIAGLKYNVGV